MTPRKLNSMRLSLAALWPLGLVVCLLAGDALANGWKEIANEQGVVVSRKDVAGRDLPIFKGVTTFKATVFDVLAVLDDIPRRTEWVFRCTESKVLKKFSDFSRVIYNRTKAPWPVSDRDVVVKTQVTVDVKAKTVMLSFKTARGYAEKRSGLVRIPRLDGFYFVEVLGENSTRVTYQIDSDPGGWLPKWVVKMASKKIPLNTLINLGKQIVKVRTPAKTASVRARWAERLKNETGQALWDSAGGQ